MANGWEIRGGVRCWLNDNLQMKRQTWHFPHATSCHVNPASPFKVKSGCKILEILLKVALLPVGKPTHVHGIDVLKREVFDVNLPLNNQLVKWCFVNLTPLLFHWDGQWRHWGGKKRGWLWWLFDSYFLWSSLLFFFRSWMHSAKHAHLCLLKFACFFNLAKYCLQTWLPNLNLADITGGICRKNIMTKFSGCQVWTWQKLGKLARTWHQLGMVKCN